MRVYITSSHLPPLSQTSGAFPFGPAHATPRCPTAPSSSLAGARHPLLPLRVLRCISTCHLRAADLGFILVCIDATVSAQSAQLAPIQRDTILTCRNSKILKYQTDRHRDLQRISGRVIWGKLSGGDEELFVIQPCSVYSQAGRFAQSTANCIAVPLRHSLSTIYDPGLIHLYFRRLVVAVLLARRYLEALLRLVRRAFLSPSLISIVFSISCARLADTRSTTGQTTAACSSAPRNLQTCTPRHNAGPRAPIPKREPCRKTPAPVFPRSPIARPDISDNSQPVRQRIPGARPRRQWKQCSSWCQRRRHKLRRRQG